jgi:hypothetical protein
MFDSKEGRNDWPPIPKPSAIESLIATRRIGEMTADEYAALARRAQIALYANDGKRIRLPLCRDSQ